MRKIHLGFGLIVLGLICVWVLWSSDRKHSAASGFPFRTDSLPDAEEVTVAREVPADTESEQARVGVAPVAQKRVADSAIDSIESHSIFLNGKVIDERKEPLVGVWLSSGYPGEETLSEEDGSFSLPVFQENKASSRGQYIRTVFLWLDGYALLRARVSTEQSNLIQLTEGEPYRVQVLDKLSKAPVASAKIEVQVFYRNSNSRQVYQPSVFVPSPIPPIWTDGQGVAYLPKGDHFPFQISASQYMAQILWSWEGQRVEELGIDRRFYLYPNQQRPSIRLLDLDGKPLVGAHVGFPGFSEKLTSDENGRVEIPVGIQSETDLLIWTDQKGWVQTMQTHPDVRFPDEVIFAHQPRAGRLVLSSNGDSGNYEVASAAAILFFGYQFYPNLRTQIDLLHWEEVSPDGSFQLQNGWQGNEIAIVVRNKKLQRVTQVEIRSRAEPIVLEVREVHPLEIEFMAQPMEYLLDVNVHLAYSDWNSYAEAPAPQVVNQGQVRFELEPGGYEVLLEFPWQQRWRSVYRFKMPAAEHRLQVPLGLLRDLSGRLTIDGEPVFPATLVIRQEGTDLREEVAVNAEGKWQLSGIPSVPLRAHPRPQNPWLIMDAQGSVEIPASAQSYSIALPVANVHLSTATPELLNARNTYVRRYHRSAKQAIPGRGMQALVQLPDLGKGVQTVQTTPCEIKFVHKDRYKRVEPHFVDVVEGADLFLDLKVIEVGLLQIKIGEIARFGRADVRLSGNASKNEALSDADLSDRSFYDRKGKSILGSYRLEEGEWKVEVHGPVRFRDAEGRRQKWGEDGLLWAGIVEIAANDTQVVWLKLDSNNKLQETD